MTSRSRRAVLLLATAALALGSAAACGTSRVPGAVGSPGSAAGSDGSDGSARTVVNNGHRLVFHVTPGRLPAVVLDAGGGQGSSYWKDLVPALAKDTGAEIITYDRAGLGASEEVAGPWRVDDAVSDLAAVLTAAGATSHVVLASHSEAGEIATYFVRSHPGWVGGAVLIDASLPDFYTDGEIDRVVAANKDQVAALASQPSTPQTRQLLSVAQDYAAMHRAYHQASWPQDLPATVIASARTPFETSPQDAQLWRDAQAAFAHAAPDRDLVVADNSSHDVPLDRPDVVIRSIHAMLARTG
ncbi:alpha/beta fold hydrolase [Kitasatospora sp. NPDC059812]|uniref:alpha/beta fold hydrolase n=1 Tax=Kitasatospora sp. NPDC059812 TaxID=3346958 RepID=UPI0036521A73